MPAAVTSTQSEAAQFLLHQIQRARALRKAHRTDPGRAAARHALREWQAARLARTHRDLLEDPRYRPAAEYFLAELYGTKDTSARDAAVERMHGTLARRMPPAALHTLGLALELDALSEELDAELLDALAQEGGAGRSLNESAYAAAYRRCDNYALRERQIELIHDLGNELAAVVRKPLVHTLLKAMRLPAKLAGVGDLQNFLERGFEAFLHMGDATAFFLETVRSRESTILQRIYAGHPEPFAGEGTAEPSRRA